MEHSLNNLDSFESLQISTRTGWWRADTVKRTIQFTSYPVTILGLEAESISFDLFKQHILLDPEEQELSDLRNLLLYPDDNDVKLTLKTPVGNQKCLIKHEKLLINESGGTITEGYIQFQGKHKGRNKKNNIQDFLHQLYQNMPLGYFRLRIEIDESQKVLDYEYLDTNAKFLEMMKKERGEIVGKMCSEVGPIFINKLDLQVLAGVAYQGNIHKQRAQFRSNERYYDTTIYSPQRGDVVALFVDVTEEVLTTEALRENKRKLKNIYEYTPVGIELYDKNGYMIDANERAAQLQDMTNKQTLIGLNLFEHPLFPKDAADSLKRGQDVTFNVKSKGSQSHKYYKSKRPVDFFKYFTIKCTALYDTNKELENYLIIVIDNTKLYKINEALKKAKLKAEESDRLKTSFLANMTHEIRTPLNAIIGFSSLLMDSTNEAERNSFMEIITKNNQHLLHLIDDILEFSKIEAGSINIDMSKIYINELCQQVINEFSNKVPPQVELTYVGGEAENPSIVSDWRQTSQVLGSLLNNALKFTYQGYIRVGYQLLNEEIKIYVEDTGIGIPEEKKEDIFNRFIKLNDFNPGNGLGLSISKKIVTKLGGKIGVKSEIGKGSCFWFTLPLKTP